MTSLRIAAAIAFLLLPANASAGNFDFERYSQELSEAFPETTMRPLFSQDRRAFDAPVEDEGFTAAFDAEPLPEIEPLPEPAFEPVASANAPIPALPEIEAPRYRLAGLLQAGATRIALVTNLATGKTHKLTEGFASLPSATGEDMVFEVKFNGLDGVLLKGGVDIALGLMQSEEDTPVMPAASKKMLAKHEVPPLPAGDAAPAAVDYASAERPATSWMDVLGLAN